MSFALASKRKTNKVEASKMSTPTKRKSSSTPHHRINNLNTESPDHIFQLQRAIGNQAVQRLMRSKGAGFDFARIGILPKLKVSQPGDAYEQEADRVAEQVMRMSDDNTSGARLSSLHEDEERIDRKCSACEMEEEEREKGMFDIRRKTKSSTTAGGIEASDKSINEIDSSIHSSSGSPLDVNTKEFAESRFGYNFSKIRIHTDSVAARSANSVNALAYTVGNDIVFAEGQYQTSTESGRRLLAHELTHVIQQDSNPSLNRITRKANPNQDEQTVQMCPAPLDPNGEWATDEWLYQMRREPKGSNRILLALGRKGPAKGRSVELLHQALLAWQCQHIEESKHGITISEYQSGEYREGTREVVRDFQKWAGVARDGIVGPYTIEALDYKVVGGPPHVSEAPVEHEYGQEEEDEKSGIREKIPELDVLDPDLIAYWGSIGLDIVSSADALLTIAGNLANFTASTIVGAIGPFAMALGFILIIEKRGDDRRLAVEARGVAYGFLAAAAGLESVGIPLKGGTNTKDRFSEGIQKGISAFKKGEEADKQLINAHGGGVSGLETGKYVKFASAVRANKNDNAKMEEILNNLYQQQIEALLSESFLGILPAKSPVQQYEEECRLKWPEPNWFGLCAVLE